jgi:hypothetical protein
MRSAVLYLRQVLEFQKGYDELPVIYKGIARTSVLQRIAALSGGSFFQSLNPDLYSAIALSLILQQYGYSRKPYSVNGTSGHSNSASQMNPSLDASPARTFMKEDNIPFHRDLIFAPCLALQVAESFLQARERLPSEGAKFSLDMKLVLKTMVEEVAISDYLVYEQTREAVLRIAALHGLSPFAEVLLAGSRHRPKPPPIAMAPGYNVVHRQHIVDCARLGVRDIHQAAAVCKTISDAHALGFIRDPGAIAMTTFEIVKGLTKRMYRRWLPNAPL